MKNYFLINYSIKAAGTQELVIFCAVAQSDIMPYGIVIFLPLAKVVLYSPFKLAKRISLGL